MNSGPLSDRMYSGSPLVKNSSASASITSRDVIFRLTTIARLSRVNSSTTVSIEYRDHHVCDPSRNRRTTHGSDALAADGSSIHLRARDELVLAASLALLSLLPAKFDKLASRLCPSPPGGESRRRVYIRSGRIHRLSRRPLMLAFDSRASPMVPSFALNGIDLWPCMPGVQRHRVRA